MNFLNANCLADSSSSQSVVPGPKAPENLDMKILGPHSRSSELGILGVEPSNLCIQVVMVYTSLRT